MSDLSNDLSEKLDSILSNPEMMAQIKRLADTMTSGTAAPKEDAALTEETMTAANIAPKKDGGEPPAQGARDITDVLSTLTALSGERRGKRGGGNIAHGRALLLALKPYLDDKRCEKIDKLLRMMQLAEMAGYFI